MPETAGIHPREIFSPPAGNDGTPGEGAAGTVSNLDTGAQPVSSSTGEFCGPFGRGGYVRAPVCLCVGRRVRARGLRPTSPTLKKFWGADVQDRGHPLARKKLPDGKWPVLCPAWTTERDRSAAGKRCRVPLDGMWQQRPRLPRGRTDARASQESAQGVAWPPGGQQRPQLPGGRQRPRHPGKRPGRSVASRCSSSAPSAQWADRGAHASSTSGQKSHGEAAIRCGPPRG